MNKFNLLSWILAILLALVFIMAGGSKLAGTEQTLANLKSWGYPLWTRFPIGFAELILALGLFIPKYRKLSVLLVFIWVALAIYTHLQAEPMQVLMTATPLIFAVVNSLLLYAMINTPSKEN